MINQRKKKRKDVLGEITNLSRRRTGDTKRGLLGSLAGDESSQNESTDNFVRDIRRDSKGLGNEFDKQVTSIQEDADNRADAEESNLDILDRGSRYTRQNKKLKKFEV
jgi:hypothetical protein